MRHKPIHNKMIQEITVENFLSFKHKTTFSFEADKDDNYAEDTQVVEVAKGVKLLRFAALYGANASGKSNFLKIFFFLHDFILRDVNSVATGVEPFLLDDKTAKGDSKFDIIFYDNSNKKYRYFLRVNPQNVVYEKLEVADTLFFERKTKGDKTTITYNFEIDPQVKNGLDWTCRKNMSLFAAYNSSTEKLTEKIVEIENVLEYFKNFLPIITDKKDVYTKIANDFVSGAENIDRQFIDDLKLDGFDNIGDICFSLVKNDGEEKIRDEYAVEVKVDGKTRTYNLIGQQQSNGTKRFVALYYIMKRLVKNNAFLAADELETSIHPDLFEKLIYDFVTQKNSRSQLIITTHYSGLMETVNNLVRKDSIRFAEKIKDGSTRLFSLADFNLTNIKSIYKAYREGRFGAVAEIEYYN